MSSTTRASSACQPCRSRKIKCSGGHPCAKCAPNGRECYYPVSQRRRRKSNPRTSGNALESRLARVESLLSAESSEATAPPATTGFIRSSNSRNDVRSGLTATASSRVLDTNEAGALPARIHYDSVFSPSFRRSHLPTPSAFSASPSWTRTDPQRTSSSELIDPSGSDEEATVIPLESDNYWEHHGPGAWVSICSQPGLKWVCQRTGSLDFIQSAKGLIRGWTERLRYKDDNTRNQCASEPDEQTAWIYCTAYFERSYDAVFGVVHRQEFENLLRGHFERRRNGSVNDDPCWLALRNVVYAAGCRSSLSKDQGVSFADAQEQAWRYFENALSALRDLLFFPTGLTAVQALALMTLYVEGLGSPALEYMLCSNAVRAAQSKGLHRQPSKSWDLPESEILRRNWLFWAIYCCDKQLAFRCGRPSAIDDDNISCQIPTKTPDGSTSDITIFTAIVKHAQISSQISKRLMSVKAFRQTSTEFFASVTDLHAQLTEFRDSLPLGWKPGVPITSLPSSQSSARRTQIYYLHFAYYGSLIATHVLLTYPWMSGRFGAESHPPFRNQVSQSSITVAEAARNIILNLRSLDLNAATPAFLTFYYPILAHINLFIFVLKYPSLPTAGSDVALLDTSAGHFGYMDYVTSSELAFSFARESASLARATVERAAGLRMEDNPRPLSQSDPVSVGNVDPEQSGVAVGEAGNANQTQQTNLSLMDEIPGLDSVDFDMEFRNLFSSMDFDALSTSGFDFFQMI